MLVLTCEFFANGGSNMPVYEYECKNCGDRFEVFQKFSDPLLTVCKIWNTPSLRKLLSPAAFVLKGGGWYATDYKSNDGKQAASKGKATPDAQQAGPCASGCCSGSCQSKAEP